MYLTSRYGMASLQFLMFLFIFCHCLEIYANPRQAEFSCPQPLLLLCTLLSSSVMVAGLLAAGLGIFLLA